MGRSAKVEVLKEIGRSRLGGEGGREGEREDGNVREDERVDSGTTQRASTYGSRGKSLGRHCFVGRKFRRQLGYHGHHRSELLLHLRLLLL